LLKSSTRYSSRPIHVVVPTLSKKASPDPSILSLFPGSPGTYVGLQLVRGTPSLNACYALYLPFFLPPRPTLDDYISGSDVKAHPPSCSEHEEDFSLVILELLEKGSSLLCWCTSVEMYASDWLIHPLKGNITMIMKDHDTIT
jgi:hypothetical protein